MSPDPDWFTYFTPLCIFAVVVCCFIRFAAKGCCTRSPEERPLQVSRPEYIVWNTREQNCEESLPPFPRNNPSSLQNVIARNSQLQPFNGIHPYILDARTLMDCPPKYEDAIQTPIDAPPGYGGSNRIVDEQQIEDFRSPPQYLTNPSTPIRSSNLNVSRSSSRSASPSEESLSDVSTTSTPLNQQNTSMSRPIESSPLH